MGELILGVMVGAPWATAAVAAVTAARASPHVAARLSAALTGAGFAISVVAAVITFSIGPVVLEYGGSGVQLDPLSVLISMLVFGLSGLIQSFAVRYLRGDPRQGWFVVSAGALTASTVLLVSAASVIVFAFAWVAAGAALVAALATYPDLPQAREGVRRTASRLAIADAGLLVGVGIVVIAGGGDRPLSEIGAAAQALGEPLNLAVAVLLVGAALAHSSQIPFHGWLPFTLAAPTPVSALMHAGVVNAGAILLVRFSPMISTHAWLMIAIALLGGATLVWASAARLVRPDVKGRLVFSTMAQMGFMIMACGLGAYAAAIFHLIAHSLFKSSLFLGAGMGVRRSVIERDRPVPQPATGVRRVLTVVIAIVIPASGLIAAELLLAESFSPATLTLLAFVAVTGAITLGSALITRFTWATAFGGIVGMLALTFGYVAFLTAFSAALDPVSAAEPAPAWLVIIPALGLLVLEVLPRTRALQAVRDRVYTRAISTPAPPLAFTKGLV